MPSDENPGAPLFARSPGSPRNPSKKRAPLQQGTPFSDDWRAPEGGAILPVGGVQRGQKKCPHVRKPIQGRSRGRAGGRADGLQTMPLLFLTSPENLKESEGSTFRSCPEGSTFRSCPEGSTFRTEDLRNPAKRGAPGFSWLGMRIQDLSKKISAF